jgi:hypothetical protein
MTTTEIIDRVRTALAYLEDGARETGLVRLREVVHAASSNYRPLVDLATGREAVAIGSTLVDGFERLEPTDRDGVYRASDGSEWVGCSDGIWRSGAVAGRARS